MSPGAQDLKTGHDALGIAGKDSGRSKHEIKSRRPRYRRKRVREGNMKSGADALSSAENEYGRAKHENWT
jgi:hypothetical protein